MNTVIVQPKIEANTVKGQLDQYGDLLPPPCRDRRNTVAIYYCNVQLSCYAFAAICFA